MILELKWPCPGFLIPDMTDCSVDSRTKLVRMVHTWQVDLCLWGELSYICHREHILVKSPAFLLWWLHNDCHGYKSLFAHMCQIQQFGTKVKLFTFQWAQYQSFSLDWIPVGSKLLMCSVSVCVSVGPVLTPLLRATPDGFINRVQAHLFTHHAHHHLPQTICTTQPSKVRLPWRPQTCNSTIWWNTVTHLTHLLPHLSTLSISGSCADYFFPFSSHATWTSSFAFIFASVLICTLCTLGGWLLLNSLFPLSSMQSIKLQPAAQCVYIKTFDISFSNRHLGCVGFWETKQQGSCDTQMGSYRRTTAWWMETHGADHRDNRLPT